jgi:hypothetical protein
MFREHAMVWPFRSWRIAPRRVAAFNNSHSNDNRPGLRRPPGQCRRPKQALACHWIEIDGRLECRWEQAKGDAASQGCPKQPRPTGRAFEPPLCSPVRGAELARAAAG